MDIQGPEFIIADTTQTPTSSHVKGRALGDSYQKTYTSEATCQRNAIRALGLCSDSFSLINTTRH